MRVAFFIVFVRNACFHSVASRDWRRLLGLGPSFQDFGDTREPDVGNVFDAGSCVYYRQGFHCIPPLPNILRHSVTLLRARGNLVEVAAM